MKKLFLAISIILSGLLLALVVRALLQVSKQKTYPPIDPIVVPSQAGEHLAAAIRLRTISHNAAVDFDSTAFRGYVQFLADTYPRVDSLLYKEHFNDFSLLYRWEGEDPGLDPILLMSHYDVVPVEQVTLNRWEQGPYSGFISGDTIWGRGAIDDKTAGIAIMETFERLLSEDFQPQRSIYLALGHDEEKGGARGAAAIAGQLTREGVRFDYILDEGGAITRDIIPGVKKNVALIGIAEKGYLDLELSASLAGGHSSIPLATNSIDVLSAGLARLRANPFPARITRPVSLFFDYLGPESSLGMKLAFTNADILEPLLLKGLARIPQGKANIRTTMVPTIFQSGIKENVIPKVASATINLRIIPGETVAEAMEYVRSTINDDRIRIKALEGASEPSEVSDVQSPQYEMVYRSIREVFPEVVVVPQLLVGGTDSRYFADLTEHIFRFRPIHINPDNIQSFHGLNERVTIEELEGSIRFYYQLIRNNDI